MAIVIQPLMSAQASGNVGPLNFTRWNGRSVARAAPAIVVPNTPAQIVCQESMSLATGDWGALLTQAMREAWIVYARTQFVSDRLGTRRHPTGFNLYVSRHIRAERMGFPELEWPPDYILDKMATRIPTISGPGSGIVKWRLMGWVGTTPPIVWREYWIAGGYLSEGRLPRSTEWRFKMYINTSSYAIHAGVPHDWYWVRGRGIWEDGQVTGWLTAHVRAAF